MMEPEKGHNLDADPDNKSAQSEGQTATMPDEDKGMSLEALESDLDKYGAEGKVEDKTKSPVEGTVTEPWYKRLNVPGLDSEEKAIEEVNSIRSDYGRIIRENAELKKLFQKSPGETKGEAAETPTQIPGLSAFIDKHTMKDAVGNVISTDYDAAMKEYTEMREKNLITRIGEVLQETQESSAKTTKVRTDMENLAKEGLIPEYRRPVYKDGQLVDAGSEFGQQVDGYQRILEERSAKVPFHLDPEREGLTVIFSAGMTSIQEKRTAREATKKRRHPMSENTPPIGSFVYKGKDVSSMTGAEADALLSSLE